MKTKNEIKMKTSSKWEGVPGVVYPEKKDDTPRPCVGEAPKGFIPTAEAASLLGCSPCAARQLLARYGVKRVLVAGVSGRSAFFSRAAVRRVARRLPACGEAPLGLVSASCAVSLLGLARSALDRLEKRGLLHVVRCRVRGRRGARVRCFYDAAELLALRQELARRLRELEGGGAA